MQERKSLLESEELSKVVVQGMLEKKADDIVVLDLRQVTNSIADYFVICTGASDTQVDAISGSVEEYVSKADKQNPWHKEGLINREWVLLDYIDVVVHVFKEDTREFYGLENLWGDAKVTKIAYQAQL